MEVREAELNEWERWDDFVRRSPQGSFLQTWEWGAVQEAAGLRIWRLVVEEADDWQAVLLVVRRELPLGWSWLYGPWGPNFASASLGMPEVFLILQKKMEELAKEERAVWVRVDTPFVVETKEAVVWGDVLEEGGWKKSEREMQPRETLIMDLGKTEEELLTGMKSKTRYNVRLAERKGVTVRWSQDVKEVALFWQMAQEVAGRTGFQYHPQRYYEAILEQMNGGGKGVAAELVIAEYEGEMLAVHIMVYAGETATYAHGASSDKRRQLMAPALLYWETMRRAKNQGCKKYDLWGVAPEGANKDHAWAGVTRMKEGFGGRRESYMGAYDLVLQLGVYRVIEVARRIKRRLVG